MNANGKIDITSYNNEMTFYYADDYVQNGYCNKYATPQQIDIRLAPVTGGVQRLLCDRRRYCQSLYKGRKGHHEGRGDQERKEYLFR